MEKQISCGLGIMLGFLAATGLIRNKKHVFGIMNVDTSHSLLRLPLAGVLIYGSRSDLAMTRQILLGVGGLYWIIWLFGLTDRRLWGLIPSRLTGFDMVYHFIGGSILIWLGARTGRMVKP